MIEILSVVLLFHLFGAIELFRQQATRLQASAIYCLIAQAINRIHQIHQSMQSALP